MASKKLVIALRFCYVLKVFGFIIVVSFSARKAFWLASVESELDGIPYILPVFISRV